jgi:thiol:disulfide interchange protein
VAPVVELAGSSTTMSPAPRSSTTGGAVKSPPAARAIAWERDVERALARARRTHRLVLVFVHADWSVASRRAARQLWNDPRVIRAMRSMVPLWVDVTAADHDAEARMVRFDVLGPPAVLIVDGDGKRVEASQSSPSVDSVIDLLRRAQTGTRR